MKRRQFIKNTTAVAVLSPSLGFRPSNAVKTHIITFSFDDGFRNSFIKLSEIHEEFGLKACLNVIASGHLPDFQAVDQWILPELLGDFDLWNALASKGHEVMPHSWKHSNLAKLQIHEAKDLILQCLAYFENNLTGYHSSRAVFNFPFNSSTGALEKFTLLHVRAVRTHGQGAINSFPSKKMNMVLGCESHGPANSNDWVEDKVNSFLSGNGGWLILNLHGLEEEGWGPVSSDYFELLLRRLVVMRHVDILPTGKTLQKYT